jgi:hypothetical protein
MPLMRSRAPEELNDQNTTVFERSELRSISFISEEHREPARASMGLAFFGSFFGQAKNEC